jgi:hypothetical protein
MGFFRYKGETPGAVYRTSAVVRRSNAYMKRRENNVKAKNKNKIESF